MALGALTEILGDEQYLIAELKKLNVDGYKIDISKKVKNGITGTYVNVIVNGKDEYGHVHHIDEHHHEEHIYDHDLEHPHHHEHDPGITEHISCRGWFTLILVNSMILRSGTCKITSGNMADRFLCCKADGCRGTFCRRQRCVPLFTSGTVRGEYGEPVQS